jgi:tRNA1(Val) A37 N6-methylase TrmN6
VGFEVDPGLVKLAREKINQQKLEQRVEVLHQDFMTAELSSASVMTFSRWQSRVKTAIAAPAPAGCSRRIVHL